MTDQPVPTYRVYKFKAGDPVRVVKRRASDNEDYVGLQGDILSDPPDLLDHDYIVWLDALEEPQPFNEDELEPVDPVTGLLLDNKRASEDFRDFLRHEYRVARAQAEEEERTLPPYVTWLEWFAEQTYGERVAATDALKNRQFTVNELLTRWTGMFATDDASFRETVRRAGERLHKWQSQIERLDREYNRLASRVALARTLLDSNAFQGLTHSEKRGALKLILGELMSFVPLSVEQDAANGDYIPF